MIHVAGMGVGVGVGAVVGACVPACQRIHSRKAKSVNVASVSIACALKAGEVASIRYGLRAYRCHHSNKVEQKRQAQALLLLVAVVVVVVVSVVVVTYYAHQGFTVWWS